ncbi:hypothetical protein G7092_21330 [Mucilaginibacter sp. HC2]|uniref:cell division protein ZapB n=1 Tax=Mucilaginibacter inviolabilis TaxID=2714892 RepID=UPI00140902A5|nr:cell division protein ZapB [Mucilaginibacter inviolabilis]NHA06366.1 hypothetical protein [Mucilaginibacter inviolabilis]
MKLFNLILFAGLLTGYSSYAQNTFPATGNVGIGTTTPANPLDVKVNTNTTAGINLTNSSVGSAARTRLTFFNDANYALINLNSTTYSTDPNSLLIHAPLTGGGSLIFGTAATERMRITANGNIGIGTNAPQSLLHVSGTGTFVNQTSQFDPRSLIIQSNNGGRGLVTGAQLEFVLPANTDGTNPWGQARIIAVAGNSNTGDATGKMVLGTRRMMNKVGSGSTWYYGDDIIIDGGGNVGIGTTTPSASLTVVNSTPLIQLFDKESNPADGSSEGKIAFGSAGGAEWASIEASRLTGSADDVTALKFKTSWATGAGGDGTNIERMRISFNGNVGIGTISPQNKLDVNGTIHSKAVNIDLNGWNDYVFKKDYQLRSLSEVKAYIDQNQHLPEIPSEREMIKNGLDVGEMNKLQMKKIEELTLYLIEKDTEINEQKATNNKLQEQINQLNKKLELLINKIK